MNVLGSLGFFQGLFKGKTGVSESILVVEVLEYGFELGKAAGTRWVGKRRYL